MKCLTCGTIWDIAARSGCPHHPPTALQRAFGEQLRVETERGQQDLAMLRQIDSDRAAEGDQQDDGDEEQG